MNKEHSAKPSYNTHNSSRKLKTYGRRNRGIQYKSDGLVSNADKTAKKSDGAPKAEKNGGLFGVGIARHGQARTKSETGRTIFDFESSEDELVAPVNNEQSPKRRKLDSYGSPQAHISSRGPGERSEKPNRRPQKIPPVSRTATTAPRRGSNRITPSPTKNDASLTKVEVVIHTPQKPKPDPRTPTHSQSVKRLNGSLGSGEKKLFLTDPQFQSPSAKLRRNAENLASNINSSSAPTPERKRLVDALRKEKEEISDRSSESEVSQELEITSRSSLSPQRQRNRLRERPGVSRRPKASGVHHAPPATLKATYARQRSFLNEMNAVEEIGAGGATNIKYPPKPEPEPVHHHANSFSLQFEEEAANEGGAIRSINELKRAGTNARYNAMIETIFEDIEDEEASLSRKRSGAMQLCIKLFDSDFMQRFINNSLEKRFANIRQIKWDVISGYTSVCIYTLLLQLGNLSPVSLHLCWEQTLKLAPFLLLENEGIAGIAKRRENNMSNAGKLTLQELSAKLQDKIWGSQIRPSVLTPRLVSLRSLELAIRKLRETGGPMEDIPDTALRLVVDVILQHTGAGDVWSDDNILALELACSILESYTIDALSLSGDQQEQLKRLSRIGLLLTRLDRRSDQQSLQVLILAIRLILNITNNNPVLSAEFAHEEFIAPLAHTVLSRFHSVGEATGNIKGIESDLRSQSQLDIVILALGTLINLTEWSTVARNLLLQGRLNCGEDHSDSIPLIDRFISLFVGGLGAISEADSVVQTHSNVAFGYLSVLLCTECLDDNARSLLRSRLQPSTFSRLLGIVEEFLYYHRKVEEELTTSHDKRGMNVDDDEDPAFGFTGRLQGIVDRIRSLK